MMKGDSFSRFAEVAGTAFLVSGIILLFMGAAGIVISVTLYNVGFFKDNVTSFAFGFFNFFMALLGVFLMLYHGKILVKPEQQ
jgi:hypothetical protein